MSKVIYIEKHESTKEIVGHFKEVPDKNLILVVPKQAEIFSEPKNLVELKEKADAHSKHVTIITLDSDGQRLAELAGLAVSKPKRGAKGDLEHSLLSQEPKSGKRDNVLKDLWDPIVRRKKPLWKRVLYVACALILVSMASAAVWYIQAVKTEITLKTDNQEFNSTVELLIDSKALDEREENEILVVPGRVARKTMEMEDEFTATGKKVFGDKAKGVVQFYNFSEDTVTLKGSDTILQAGNLRFKLNADVLRIRPTARIGLNNKIDATSLSAPQGIEAEEVGEAYNLTLNTQFEVVNAGINASPKLFYAQSTQSLSGGSSKEITVVDYYDVEGAAGILKNRILDQALGILEKTLRRGEKITQDKVELTAVERNASPTVGSETRLFKLKVTADIIGLAYNRGALEKILQDKIFESVPDGRKLASDAKIINLSLKSIDLGAGQAVIENNYRGLAYPDFDNDDVKYVLRGKNEKEIADYFKQKGVQSTRVRFTPAWLGKASWLGSKIFIKIE